MAFEIWMNVIVLIKVSIGKENENVLSVGRSNHAMLLDIIQKAKLKCAKVLLTVLQ